MTKKAKLEWWFYDRFGFFPAGCFDLAKMKAVVKVNKTDTDLEKFIKTNYPFEYFKYISSRTKIKVGDILMKLSTNSSAGCALIVYKITSQAIETCMLCCKNPFNDQECEVGERFCFTKDETLVNYVLKAEEFVKQTPTNISAIKEYRKMIRRHRNAKNN